MKISRVELAEIIAEKTMKVDAHKLAQEVAAFLLQQRASAELDAIMRDVQQIRFDHGIIEGTLECAHEPTPALIDDAKSLLKDLFPAGKSYFLHTTVNASLLGGARIVLPGQQLDLSLRRKVTTLKQLTAA